MGADKRDDKIIGGRLTTLSFRKRCSKNKYHLTLELKLALTNC